MLKPIVYLSANIPFHTAVNRVHREVMLAGDINSAYQFTKDVVAHEGNMDYLLDRASELVILRSLV